MRKKKGKRCGGFSKKLNIETSMCGDLVTNPCLTLAIPWTVTRQTPLSIGVARQEYWSELPFPSPEDLPDPGIESVSPA